MSESTPLAVVTSSNRLPRRRVMSCRRFSFVALSEMPPLDPDGSRPSGTLRVTTPSGLISRRLTVVVVVWRVPRDSESR
jgi:hypothetical protein